MIIPLPCDYVIVSGLLEFSWERSFNLILMITVNATRSEFFAELGMKRPFLEGSHYNMRST
jgi:hypothetical protein